MEIHASARRDACCSERIGPESVEMIIWQEDQNHPHCNFVNLHRLKLTLYCILFLTFIIGIHLEVNVQKQKLSQRIELVE